MAKVGDRIDKFTLVRQLGAGGMGETWEAVRQVDRDFEQRVAIKVAEQALLHTPDGLASFRREAALAASLRHPNIAAVLDLDESAGYIVCELVDGADLRAVLRSTPGGRLEASLVVYVLAQIARGLSHAHRRILRGRPSPVIHRDMSPGNVVLDYDGNVKIVDFGIAKVLAAGAEIPESVKGKLSYMAPEQAMGSRMDGRVDQYALGVIAYEALSGVRPNDGAHEGETLANILGGKHILLHERVPNAPARLCKTVERMLAKRPSERFANIEALLDALAELTPKLTAYRSLVPLVMAARQPHTIMSENGRFVSRPVESLPPLLQESSWPNEQSGQYALPGAVRAPQALRLGMTAPGMGMSGPPPATMGPGSAMGMAGAAQPHYAALAVTLGNTQASHRQAQPQPQPPSVDAVKSTPPPLPLPTAAASALPTPKPAASNAPARRRGRTARIFWKVLAALAVSLLMFALWLVFFPRALQLLPESVRARVSAVLPAAKSH